MIMSPTLEQIFAAALTGPDDLRQRCVSLLKSIHPSEGPPPLIQYITRGGRPPSRDILDLCEHAVRLHQLCRSRLGRRRISRNSNEEASAPRCFRVYVSDPGDSPAEPYTIVGDDLLSRQAATLIDLDTPCKLATAIAQSEPPRIELLLDPDHGPLLRVDAALLEHYTFTCPAMGRLAQVSSSPEGAVFRAESFDSYATAVRLQEGVLFQLDAHSNTATNCFGAATSLGAIDRLSAGPTRLKSCWGLRSICLCLPPEAELARAGNRENLSGLVRELTRWAGLWQDPYSNLTMRLLTHRRQEAGPKWLDDVLPAVEAA